MKKVFCISVLIACLGSGMVNAQQSVSFNFSDASRPVAGWVNVTGDPSKGVRSVTDATTGISINSVSMANWPPYGTGASKDDNGNATGGFFPGTVMKNRWYVYGNVTANYNAAVPQLVISGLNRDSVYTFKMSSTSPSALLSDPTMYRVTGVVVYGPIGVSIHDNTVNGATFYNVAPDDSGRVKVYVNTVFNTTDVADISGLQIIRGRTAGPAPIISITSPVPNDVRAEDGDIVFSSDVVKNGAGILKVEYYRDNVLLGSSSTAPYNWTWEHVDEGQYTIRARVIDSLGMTSTDDVSFRVESLAGFWSMTGNIRANADSNFLGTVDTNRLAFRTNNLERVSILKDGTVGIGTKDTKGYLLAVNGSAIFTKVRVKTAGTWPDYVFADGYRLPDLSAIERYVAVHKHLPGLEPASDVERDGIDVAAQQAALLQKVEELTLYLIEENKRLRSQNSKLEEQQQSIDKLQRQIDALQKLIGSKK